MNDELKSISCTDFNVKAIAQIASYVSLAYPDTETFKFNKLASNNSFVYQYDLINNMKCVIITTITKLDMVVSLSGKLL